MSSCSRLPDLHSVPPVSIKTRLKNCLRAFRRILHSSHCVLICGGTALGLQPLPELPWPRFINNLVPALERQYPGVDRFKVQTDMCRSFAKGIRLANQHFGYEKLELMFRGQDARNPQVPPRMLRFVAASRMHVFYFCSEF